MIILKMLSRHLHETTATPFCGHLLCIEVLFESFNCFFISCFSFFSFSCLVFLNFVCPLQSHHVDVLICFELNNNSFQPYKAESEYTI